VATTDSGVAATGSESACPAPPALRSTAGDPGPVLDASPGALQQATLSRVSPRTAGRTTQGCSDSDAGNLTATSAGALVGVIRFWAASALVPYQRYRRVSVWCDRQAKDHGNALPRAQSSCPLARKAGWPARCRVEHRGA